MVICMLTAIRLLLTFVFFSCIRRHTRWNCDWSSDVCSSDLFGILEVGDDRIVDGVDRCARGFGGGALRLVQRQRHGPVHLHQVEVVEGAEEAGFRHTPSLERSEGRRVGEEETSGVCLVVVWE